MSVVAREAPSGAAVPAQLMSLVLASSEAAQQEQELTVVAYRKNLEKVQEAFQAVLVDLESFKKSVMEEMSLLRQERGADRALIEALREEVRVLKRALKEEIEELRSEFRNHVHWGEWILEYNEATRVGNAEGYYRKRVGLPKPRPVSGDSLERYVRRIREIRNPHYGDPHRYFDPPAPGLDEAIL